MPESYIATSLPPHQVAELHRLMTEEIREVAVFFMDPHGIITVWNRAAEDMKGYTAEDAIGSPLAMLYTEKDRERGWAEHNLREARTHGFYKEETWRRRKDGSLFWARIALTALHDDTDTLVGFSKVTVDLTEHHLLEQCTREREQTRRVLRAANAGMWTWHPDSGQIDVCANFLGLLGDRGNGIAGGSMSLAAWLSYVDPRDRSQVEAEFQRVLTRSDGAPMAVEMRLRQPDGSSRWFYAHADWYREKDTDPLVLSGVHVDIHGLKTTGEKLELALGKLQEGESRKDEFLAMLAHELRNPLAPIRTAAELLKVARPDDERVFKTSQIIARQVSHMTSLVDDLLDVSRVTRGLVRIEPAPVDMNAILPEAAEQTAPAFRAKAHELQLRAAAGAAMVMGDRKRLVQVISNLLNNAAKYTPAHGRVTVRTELDRDEVVVAVEDNGIGMPPELVERVFDLFAQAERTPDRSSGGLGLGLALVKNLVALHGGTVAAASPGPQQGSTFTIRLPLSQAVGEPDPLTRLEPAAAAARPLRLLVVDDNEDAAQTLAAYLEEAGHQVQIAVSASAAIAASEVAPPDVFILDIGLPELDGYQLVRHLRSRERSRAAGFDHHLVKPVDPDELMALLTAGG
jgi:PAS domain S-box-containing protein